MSIRPRNQIRGLLLVGVGGLGGHGHETHHGHQDRNQGCRHCHIRLWRWLVNGRVQYPAISTGNGADRQWQSSATTQFMRGRLSPIRFGEATRRGVRPGVYLPTGLVRRRAASRGAAATSPSASATLIGLDPATPRAEVNIKKLPQIELTLLRCWPPGGLTREGAWKYNLLVRLCCGRDASCNWHF